MINSKEEMQVIEANTWDGLDEKVVSLTALGWRKEQTVHHRCEGETTIMANMTRSHRYIDLFYPVVPVNEFTGWRR